MASCHCTMVVPSGPGQTLGSRGRHTVSDTCHQLALKLFLSLLLLLRSLLELQLHLRAYKLSF